MNVNDLLAQMGGLSSLSKELGLTEEQAASGAAALLPAIMGGFRREAEAQPDGLAGLGSLLGALGGGSLLDDVLAPRPTDVSKGNSVLGRIFGSKDVSRTVAQKASEESGLDPSVLRKMLPMLAMLAAGYMARQRGSEEPTPPATPAGGAGPAAGGLGGMLGGLLTGRGSARTAPPEGSQGTNTGGLGGLADLLGTGSGDGNPLDEILRMAGKHLNK
jgi:hypothetical protein